MVRQLKEVYKYLLFQWLMQLAEVWPVLQPSPMNPVGIQGCWPKSWATPGDQLSPKPYRNILNSKHEAESGMTWNKSADSAAHRLSPKRTTFRGFGVESCTWFH